MIKIISGAVAGLVLGLGLWWQNVETDLTPDDRAAIRYILAPSYAEELDLIRTVQQRVFDVSPVYRSIPEGQEREPADLIIAGQGLCYDRSRTIEKALSAVGFEVRHVAVYSSLTAALLPRIGSHALSEVLTSGGWMAVDSVTPWIGLDLDGNPVPVARLGTVELLEPIPDEIAILRGDFVHVVGLYSRHGQFYPPFTPFPDVNWQQFVANVF